MYGPLSISDIGSQLRGFTVFSLVPALETNPLDNLATEMEALNRIVNQDEMMDESTTPQPGVASDSAEVPKTPNPTPNENKKKKKIGDGGTKKRPENKKKKRPHLRQILHNYTRWPDPPRTSGTSECLGIRGSESRLTVRRSRRLRTRGRRRNER
nr:uncharacterized protein LOC124220216 [Neodiprion pinetum]